VVNLLLEGDDLEALLLRAHREGGAQARIVRAAKVRRGGILGFFAREGFEVAVEIPKDHETETDSNIPPNGDSFDSTLDRSVHELATGASPAERLAARLMSGQPPPAAPTTLVKSGMTEPGLVDSDFALAQIVEMLANEPDSPAPMPPDRAHIEFTATEFPHVFVPQLNETARRADLFEVTEPFVAGDQSRTGAGNGPVGRHASSLTVTVVRPSTAAEVAQHAPAPVPSPVFSMGGGRNLLRRWRPGSRKDAEHWTHEAAGPETSDRLATDRAALQALGVPAAWTGQLGAGDRFASIVTMLERLPASRIPEDAAVIAVVGPPDVVELEAQRTTLDLPAGGRPRAVSLVPGGATRVDRRAALARNKRIRPVVISVPIEDYTDPDGTRTILSNIKAEAVIVVVDASRPLAEVSTWIGALEAVDAIALIGALDAEAPAAVLGLDVPVIRVDGIAVDPIGWAALLCAHLAAADAAR
jgi:hypothetical protein